jgi:carboxyl-terminal processing protease
MLKHFPSLFLGAILGAFIALAHSVFAERDDYKYEVLDSLPLEELHTFAEVFTQIKENYVEKVDDKELLENAIDGMLSGLDPHSAYLNEDAFTEIQIGTSGEFGGLGIEVSMEDGFVRVISPIDDTPAANAGIQAGDLIVRLDGTPVQGMDLNDAVKIMRGEVGKPIVLTIIRDGEDKPLTIKVIRDIIKVKSIKSRTIEPGYVIVRISNFQGRTSEDLHSAIEKLTKENDGKIKGLILDLRNNPGGILNGAVDVADAFIKKGLLVYTEGRIDDADLKFKAKPHDILNGAPIVVLVNNGSASASEIVAGALQDHKRAIIMGTKTFGKGSVQTIIPISDNAAVKVTTARYFTPSGRSIQAEGIEPDIKLSRFKVEEINPAKGFKSLNVSEADLLGHLENDDKKKNEENSGDEESSNDEKTLDNKKPEVPLFKSDFAQYEALNLLKGLNVIESTR